MLCLKCKYYLDYSMSISQIEIPIMTVFVNDIESEKNEKTIH